MLEIVDARREERERASARASPGGRELGREGGTAALLLGTFVLRTTVRVRQDLYLSIVVMNSMGFFPNCMHVCV